MPLDVWPALMALGAIFIPIGFACALLAWRDRRRGPDVSRAPHRHQRDT